MCYGIKMQVSDLSLQASKILRTSCGYLKLNIEQVKRKLHEGESMEDWGIFFQIFFFLVLISLAANLF